MRERLGIHPDIHDHRDFMFDPPDRARRHAPLSVDLRPHCPPVFDQSRLNACSANAIASLIWYDEFAAGRLHTSAPSRLFIYYNERAAENLVARNAPVSLRDGYRSVIRHGVCREERWPYRIERFARRPPPRCYREAKDLRALSYLRIRREISFMRACLAIGRPFTVAIAVYESFMRPAVRKAGIIPLPRRGERLLGGHALLVVGYEQRQRHFIVRNSWGVHWGIAGYAHMPDAYLEHPRLAWDAWMTWRVGKRRPRA